MRTLLLIILLSPLLAFADQREVYVIDSTFCEGRALIGKATAEAKGRGVDARDWVEDLRKNKANAPIGSMLHSGIAMGLLDVEGIYSLKKNYPAVQVYMDLYNTCMAFRERTIVL